MCGKNGGVWGWGNGGGDCGDAVSGASKSERRGEWDLGMRWPD